MTRIKGKVPLFKRINNWLHLWLGLISGVIVFIVCITGCIWVFNQEITGLLDPETKVEWQNKSVLMPSEFIKIGAQHYPDKIPVYVNYLQGRTADLSLRAADTGPRAQKSDNTVLKINPYTGAVIRVEGKDTGK